MTLPEKLEECPVCAAEGAWWLYDMQKCQACGYPATADKKPADIGERSLDERSLRELVDVFKEVLDVLRKEAPGTALNSRVFTGLGIKANAAITQAEATLSKGAAAPGHHSPSQSSEKET